MKKFFLTLGITVVLLASVFAGDIKKMNGEILHDGTTITWTTVPEMNSGVYIYLHVFTSVANAEFDTSWVTLWTKYTGVVGSVTVLASAKVDTFTTLIYFDADSLAVGPNEKYQWGEALGIQFVVRDSTSSAANKAFGIPIRWQATIKGF